MNSEVLSLASAGLCRGGGGDRIGRLAGTPDGWASRSGGGMRLKILEALACSQRVIATPFAAVSIASEDVPGLVLVSTQRFAHEILRALEDSGLGPGRESASRELVAGFDWDRLVAEIDWNRIAQVH